MSNGCAGYSFRFFLVFAFAGAKVFAANKTNSTCSNHCSQQDADNKCWLQTQEYYDSDLIQSLNNWLAVQFNVDQWNWRNIKDYSHSDNASNETVSRLKVILPSNSLLDVDHLQQIIPPLINLTFTKSSSLMLMDIPEFVCPIPCDYDSRLWEYLFIASMLVNVAMLIVVIPFIIKSERRDKQLYAKQISMMQMLKPATKSRNPSVRES